MKSKLLIVAAVILLGVVVYRTQTEFFTDTTTLPDPQKMIKHIRGLLDKYDKPDVWNHAAQVMNKDPGELARQHLDIHNKV